MGAKRANNDFDFLSFFLLQTGPNLQKPTLYSPPFSLVSMVFFFFLNPSNNTLFHVWYTSTLIQIFGEDFVAQFSGGTCGTVGGANRVILEVCV